MKTQQRSSIFLAFLLFLMWALTFWNYGASMQVWKDYKIGMTPLTLFGLALNRMPLVMWPLRAATAIALAIAFGPRWTRALGALFLLFLMVLNWGAVLPNIALGNSLSGGTGLATLSSPIFPAWPLVVLLVNLLALCGFVVASLRWRGREGVTARRV